MWAKVKCQDATLDLRFFCIPPHALSVAHPNVLRIFSEIFGRISFKFCMRIRVAEAYIDLVKYSISILWAKVKCQDALYSAVISLSVEYLEVPWDGLLRTIRIPPPNFDMSPFPLASNDLGVKHFKTLLLSQTFVSFVTFQTRHFRNVTLITAVAGFSNELCSVDSL